jgi:intracellular multiplication protein IcmJ
MVPTAVAVAAHRRDHFKCWYCGFQSQKYQEAVWVGGGRRSLDGVQTVCIECYRCLNLEAARWMESAVVVWLPEVDQVTINRASRELYCARISTGRAANRARRLFDLLAKPDARPRVAARQKLGSDELDGLIARLRKSPNDPVLGAIRIFPLDRLIVREGSLRFNKYPQILAYWRSKAGPFGGLQRPTGYMDALAEAMGLGDGEPAVDGEAARGASSQRGPAVSAATRGAASKLDTPPASPIPAEPTYAVLAVRLLHDAANFFTTIARQNPPIEDQMAENARVFRELAALLEAQPTGIITDDDAAEPARSYAALAAKLLCDAATFFDSIGKENPTTEAQMAENALVFRKVAARVEADPTATPARTEF